MRSVSCGEREKTGQTSLFHWRHITDNDVRNALDVCCCGRRLLRSSCCCCLWQKAVLLAAAAVFIEDTAAAVAALKTFLPLLLQKEKNGCVFSVVSFSEVAEKEKKRL